MQVAVAARAGRPGWLNRRTILGAVLIAVSLAGGRVVLEEGRAVTGVWVAARDLAAGTRLDASNLRVEHVRFSPRLADSYLRSTHDLSSQVLTRPLAAGELVSAEWVAPSDQTGSRAVTVPVDPEHSVGGTIRPGDVVDVLATFDAGDHRARTVTLLRNAEVIDVVSAGGLVMSEKAVVGLTVSVSAEEAQRVAFASRSAELDVVRIDGVAGGSARSVVTEADF